VSAIDVSRTRLAVKDLLIRWDEHDDENSPAWRAVAAAVRQDCAAEADRRAEPLAEALRACVAALDRWRQWADQGHSHGVTFRGELTVGQDALAAHDRQAAP